MSYRIEKCPVKVPFLSVEFEGRALGVSDRVWGAPLPSNSRESRKKPGFLAFGIQKLCVSVLANPVIVGDFKRPEGAYTFRMDVSVMEQLLCQIYVH